MNKDKIRHRLNIRLLTKIRKIKLLASTPSEKMKVCLGLLARVSGNDFLSFNQGFLNIECIANPFTQIPRNHIL